MTVRYLLVIEMRSPYLEELVGPDRFKPDIDGWTNLRLPGSTGMRPRSGRAHSGCEQGEK